jgi:hypothetical protein
MDRPFAELACPKCAGAMFPQERQGIVIDVCRTCRGMFLDRGELDRLLDLEASTSVGWEPPRSDERPYREPEDLRDSRDRDRRDRGESHSKRRGGFLGELLGGFGE